MPRQPELLDHPACVFVQEHKNVEWRVSVETDAARTELAVSVADWSLAASLEMGGEGVWSARHPDSGSVDGQCELARKGAAQRAAPADRLRRQLSGRTLGGWKE